MKKLQVQAELDELRRRMPRPHHVLEIGTGPGGLAEWFCDIASGTVISVDLPNCGVPGARTLEQCERRNAILSAHSPRFVGILGDSHALSTVARVAAALNGAFVDLLFIDGDHTYQGVKADYELYSPLVAPSGLIAFHDIATAGVDGVQQFWRELYGEKQEIRLGTDVGGIGLIAPLPVVERV